MALVNVGQIIYPSNLSLISSVVPAFSSADLLDAAGEYTAVIFSAREAMTISHVGFRLASSPVGSPTADVRVETVDASGNPSGTLWAANTNAISGTLVAGWNLIALTAAATIAAGDWVCVKIVYNSGTSFVTQRRSEATRNAVPYAVTNTTGSPVKSTTALLMAVGSSSTSFYYVDGLCPAITANAITFSNSVAGTKRGLRFQVPFKCRCVGIAKFAASGSLGDYKYRLASDAGTELSSSEVTVDGDYQSAGNQTVYLSFDNPVTLDAATWYRIEIEPTSATNTNLATLSLPSANYMAAMGWPGGNAHYFTFTTAGGYIDTATDQVPFLLPIIDQVYEGALAVPAGVGSYSLTGTDAGTLHSGWSIAAAAGSYALAGGQANPIHSWRPDATTAGSYALTGTAATLTYVPLAAAFTIAADPGSYLLTGTPATLTYQPTVVVSGVETRGEWPVKKRNRSANIQAARQARDSLRQALERLYDGGEYDAPLEVLEEAQAEAVATVNTLIRLDDVPLEQLRAAEELIRGIQELIRLRLEDEARTQAATLLAQQHLRETIDIAAEVYRKTRFDYLARYALLTAE